MSEILDLTELLAVRALAPRRARFAGVEFAIRRDLTATEIVEFYGLLHAGRNIDALTMLVGADAATELARKVEPLPVEQARVVWQRLFREAGALPRLGVVDEQEAAPESDPLGESQAS